LCINAYLWRVFFVNFIFRNKVHCGQHFLLVQFSVFLLPRLLFFFQIHIVVITYAKENGQNALLSVMFAVFAQLFRILFIIVFLCICINLRNTKKQLS
ncbi:hypothetical protein D917_07980, partial [Trichinella nativa]